MVLQWLSTVKSGQKSRSDTAVRRDSANGRVDSSSLSSCINKICQPTTHVFNHKSSKLIHVFFSNSTNTYETSLSDQSLRSYWLSEEFHTHNHIINTLILLPNHRIFNTPSFFETHTIRTVFRLVTGDRKNALSLTHMQLML